MLQDQKSLLTITIPSCRVGRELHCAWFGSDGRQETSTWPQAIPFPYNQSVKASLVVELNQSRQHTMAQGIHRYYNQMLRKTKFKNNA